MIYEYMRIWYTLMFSIDIYHTCISIVQTVHGSINMWQHPNGWPGPSRCNCHAMQLGCSHHTLVLLHHGPLKHPQTPKHMGLPEKAPPPTKKKLPNLNNLAQTPHARDKTMGFTLFFVSEVKIQICIHMAINYKRLQIMPVWNHMADSLDNLLEKWSHNVICILLASKTPGDWLQLETSIHK